MLPHCRTQLGDDGKRMQQERRAYCDAWPEGTRGAHSGNVADIPILLGVMVNAYLLSDCDR